MPLPSVPVPLPEAFATSAAGSFITNPIPDTTATPGAASWALGFPPLTMTPEVGGGVPPFGQDFNGVLFMMSSHIVYAQQGLLYQYDPATSTLLGGYAKGTILLSNDGSTVWYSIANSNTTDPDGATPANWAPVYAYGITSVSGTGGTITLTQAQAAKGIISIGGALTTNLIVVVPAHVQQWLVTNVTSGAHTVTVKTPSGTGVVIPQTGISAPSGVYCNGTNVYLTSITTAGLAPINSPAFTGIPTGPTAAPGTNTTQLATTAFVQAELGGFAPLASPHFTGTPLGTTASPGDTSTKLATTAFVNPAGTVLAASGSYHTPSGLIIKWGSFALPAGGAVTTAFPVAFPTACFAVVPSQGGSAGYGYPFGVQGFTAANFTVQGAGGGIQPGTGYYVAFGH